MFKYLDTHHKTGKLLSHRNIFCFTNEVKYKGNGKYMFVNKTASTRMHVSWISNLIKVFIKINVFIPKSLQQWTPRIIVYVDDIVYIMQLIYL